MRHTSAYLSRTISIVGAGIILATFVVKDVLSDHMKDLNDSLTLARSFYLTQLPINFMEGDVNVTKYDVGLVLITLGDKEKGPVRMAEDKMSASLETNRARAQIISEYMVTLTTLITKLPNDASDKKSAIGLYVQCKQVMNEVQALQNSQDAVFAAFLKTPITPKAAQQYKYFSSEIVTIPPRIDQISHGASVLTQTVVANLESIVRRSEKRNEIYTMLSYVLFAIGWVTSLAGQLLGVSSEGAQ
jgi:hypothetical protein